MCCGLANCTTKVYPESMLSIDSSFLSLYKVMTNSDSLVFINGIQKKLFVIGRKDSIINNSKGYFINSRPYKTLKTKFVLVGNDMNEDEESEILVNKDPEKQENSVRIKLQKFRCRILTKLPNIDLILYLP